MNKKIFDKLKLSSYQQQYFLINTQFVNDFYIVKYGLHIKYFGNFTYGGTYFNIYHVYLFNKSYINQLNDLIKIEIYSYFTDIGIIIKIPSIKIISVHTNEVCFEETEFINIVMRFPMYEHLLLSEIDFNTEKYRHHKTFTPIGYQYLLGTIYSIYIYNKNSKKYLSYCNWMVSRTWNN